LIGPGRYFALGRPGAKIATAQEPSTNTAGRPVISAQGSSLSPRGPPLAGIAAGLAAGAPAGLVGVALDPLGARVAVGEGLGVGVAGWTITLPRICEGWNEH